MGCSFLGVGLTLFVVTSVLIWGDVPLKTVCWTGGGGLVSTLIGWLLLPREKPQV